MAIIEKIIFASSFLLLGGFLGAVQRTREDPQAIAERKPPASPKSCPRLPGRSCRWGATKRLILSPACWYNGPMLTKLLFPIVLAFLLWAGHAFAWAFAVCGDSHNARNGIFPRILSAVADSDMEFLVLTGDMVRRDSPKEWETFRKTTASFHKPLRAVIGNHELYGGGSREKSREKFAERFGAAGASWSFTHKDAHFALVDNAGGAFSDRTLDWLDRDLAAHPKGKESVSVIVVAMHISPRTDGIFPHGTSRSYDEQSKKLLSILKRHKADLVLCGHEHMQHVEDWDGIRVVVSGGAGAPLLPFQRYGFYRIDVENGAVRETFLPVSLISAQGAQRGVLPKRPMERGNDCVDRNGIERAKIASVAEEEAPRVSKIRFFDSLAIYPLFPGSLKYFNLILIY